MVSSCQHLYPQQVRRQSAQVASPRRVYGVRSSAASRSGFLCHPGYGSGLLAMDSARRISHKFPVREVLKEHRYGCITIGVAGIGTDVCAVRTAEGCFLWRPGAMPRDFSRAINASTWPWDSRTPARSARRERSAWTMSYQARIG